MGSGSELEPLLSRLRLFRDPRKERGRRHSLVDVLLITLVAMLCGADDAEAMESFGESSEDWFREFLELPHGIPSQDTYLRVFALLSSDTVQVLFMDWINDLRTVRDGGPHYHRREVLSA